MSPDRHMKRARTRSRTATALVALTAAVASLALLPAGAPAANTIAAGAGGTTLIVNGTTVSTSNLTLAQLGNLQGVPASTVNLELEGVAAGTPSAAAVDSVVSSLPAETLLSSALSKLSGASGGTISPETALQRVVAFNGNPGAAGADGAGGANGTGTGTNGSSGSSTLNAGSVSGGANAAPAKRTLTIRTASRSLKGHPGSRVRVRFNVSSAARFSYSGSKLRGGSRMVRAGTNLLVVTLPGKPGSYRLTLKAVDQSNGTSAQAVVMLQDARLKHSKAHH
jgi:hypothetical protein